MSRRKKIICVLIILLISGVGLFDNTDVVYAGCTKTCDKCNGLGTFGNSASASGTVNGFSYNSYVKTEGCWNCGGSGTKTVYYASSSPGSGQSYTSGSYTKGTGVIATSCTYPSKYSYTSGKDDSSGVTYSDGVRYKNCTVCGTRLETAYKVVVEAGTGIASVSGGGYYNAGALVSYSCTVSTGYTFSKWSDGDTRQSWTSGNGLHCPRYYKATAIPISYTQTTNHYIWNPDTSKWDYWTKTTTSANYDSTFKPSYTTTPTGYYNYSIDYKDGWKVTGAGTFCAYYYPNTYTITYDANGGTGVPATQTKEKGKALTLSTTKPTRKGYTFQGWATSASATKATYKAGASYKTDAKCTLYAVWKANSYKIAFNSNGGTGTMSTISATYGKKKTLSINKFTRKGYAFANWNTKKDGSGKAYANEAIVKKLTSKKGKTVTLYAQWKPVIYTITYDLNKGKVKTANPSTYTIESATITLNNPTRKGYTFKGWYTSEEWKTKVTQIVKGSTGNLKLYARWTANKYTIKYYCNKGTGKMSSTSATYGKNVALRSNAFKRKGYVFKGWNTKADGSGKTYTNKQKVKNLSSKSNGTVKLYAQWEKKK